MSLTKNQYAGRNSDIGRIIHARGLDRDVKAALVAGRYLIGTEEDDMHRDAATAVQIATGIGRAAFNGLANAIRWGRREYHDYQKRCEEARAAQEEADRIERVRIEALKQQIRNEKLRARRYFIKLQQKKLRRRRAVLAEVRAHFDSPWRRAWHFLKRKDVRNLGEQLALRGLRSLATHALLTVCTKGAGYHLALSADAGNVAQQLQDAQDLQAIYDSVQGVNTSAHGLVALDLMLDTFNSLGDLPSGDPSILDIDDQLQTADTRYQALVDQNHIIEETAAAHHDLLQDFDDAHVLEPQFGSTGDSRVSSDLIGPNNESTTWDENGHLLDKNDHDHEIDPLSCTVKPDDPPPPPPPPTSANAPKS